MIGFVGRLVSQKAPEVLLKAFVNVVNVCPAARLAMVGSGPLAAEMEALAAALGVADRVLWLGERDARGLLAGFDVFALASRKEGLPYVVLEAMAAGLPVVATTSAGVEILVEPGVNGAVVPVGDAVAFGTALAALAIDPALRARQGQAAPPRRVVLGRGDGRPDPRCLPCRPRPLKPNPSRHALFSTFHRNPSFHLESPSWPLPRNRVRRIAPGPRLSHSQHRLASRSGADRAVRAFATPDISDLLNRLYAVNPAITLLTDPGHTLVGSACTVKVFPGDNLMVHKALDVARPGDVIVVDAGGATTNAVLGDLISAKAKHRGIAGFVVDGLIRDLPAIAELDFPVFAAARRQSARCIAVPVRSISRSAAAASS